MTCASPASTARLPDRYIISTSSEPLLTADQERRLAGAAARGDSDARDRMVSANLRLVVRLARRFAGVGLDFEDLVGEGNLGLIKAVQQYDPALGVRLATYARHWIEEAIRSGLTHRSRAIRLPSHMVTLMRKWRRAEAELEREVGRAPTFEAVGDRMGLGEARRALVRSALKSTVVEGPDAETAAPLETIAGPAAHPGVGLERVESNAGLWERMTRRLDARERELLALRFGLDGGEPLTLKQAGTRLGVGREWARKLEARAVAKLRD